MFQFVITKTNVRSAIKYKQVAFVSFIQSTETFVRFVTEYGQFRNVQFIYLVHDSSFNYKKELIFVSDSSFNICQFDKKIWFSIIFLY